MKARLLIATLLTILVFGLASAQSYQIRVTNNTNLRTSYSLDSAVLASARAGTTLQVVGGHNRWLQVQRDGRQYWMASWVSHTRVEGQQTAPADIDNCCFVNRQCATNQDWVAGYHAYQRNECPVSQPVTPGTAPISAPADQTINNCCFVNRQCATEQEWVDGYNAFQYDNQCLAQPRVQQPATTQFACQRPVNSHPVPIWGPAEFQNRLGCALDLLKSRAGGWYWYDFTVSGINSIRARGGSRVSVNSRTGEVKWGTDRALYSDFASLASTMVHEACHVHRRRAGLESGGVEGELDCTQKEIKALDALHPNHPKRPSQQHIVDNLRNDPNLRWWGRH